ncbi:MAG TPA: hypothetical protein VHD33_04130, partial [Legionellaceae bacterium]|nr:hypothetical protein [Legionellaceae bacterium]
MFITVSTDQATIKDIRTLNALYPEEVSYSMQNLIQAEYHLSNAVEKPIKRITILGHSGITTYGGMSANVFAEHLIQLLKVNEKSS